MITLNVSVHNLMWVIALILNVWAFILNLQDDTMFFIIVNGTLSVCCALMLCITKEA